jgi:protein ImuA
MSPATDIERLRRRIAVQERLSSLKRPIVTLGPDRLDAALPDGGLASGALHEIVPTTPRDFAAAAGFGFCLLARLARVRPGTVLWALPAYRSFHEGELYPLGLAALGFDPSRLVQIEVRKGSDILWALEEGLAHSALAAVIGVLPEGDRAYDFTASRRLAMRSAGQGVTALILHDRAHAGATTAADTRWSVGLLPSVLSGGAEPGLGPPRWRLELTKSRRGRPGRWDVEWNHETLSFRLPAPLADRTPAWAHGAIDGQIDSHWAEAS